MKIPGSPPFHLPREKLSVVDPLHTTTKSEEFKPSSAPYLQLQNHIKTRKFSNYATIPRKEMDQIHKTNQKHAQDVKYYQKKKSSSPSKAKHFCKLQNKKKRHNKCLLSIKSQPLITVHDQKALHLIIVVYLLTLKNNSCTLETLKNEKQYNYLSLTELRSSSTSLR